jgi:nucleotide-binding universal stress UspA family protein
MAFNTILTITGVEDGDDDLKVGADLAESVGAHLSVLVLALAAPPPIGEYAAMVSEGWLAERQADAQALQERVAGVSRFLAKRAVAADVASAYPELTWADEAVGRRACYADLTLVGPTLAGNETLCEKTVTGALFFSGKPLLLMPAGATPTLTPKRVLVGWDARVEASRAIREALDMLTGADEVHVALVDPVAGKGGHGEEPGADIAAYLARHGVKVVVDRLPSEGRPVAEVLERHARDTAAEMLVIGAYGHSRLRERLFGGTTRSILADPALPVFLAR